jgi:hypothetical protein
MVDLISLLDSMKENNYIFFNVFGLLLTISSIITLFVTLRGYPESTFAVQLEYFSIVIFVISVLAIPFLIKISNVKFSLQDLFWTVFIFLIFVNFILFGGINEHRYTIFLLLSLLYICFRVICSHNKIGKNIIILCLLVCGISQSILGFLQLFDIYPSYLSRFKVTGSFFNPGPFSALIAMSLVLAVSLLLKYDYKSNKYLKLVDNRLFLDEELIDNYRFKYNYYFVVGDNIMHSSDSRYFGFIPEEFIVGVVCCIKD